MTSEQTTDPLEEELDRLRAGVMQVLGRLAHADEDAPLGLLRLELINQLRPLLERKGGFYVTIRRGKQTGLLLGPYETKGAAARNIPRAREAAEQIDTWTGFDLFGVTRVQPKAGRELPAGRLNERIGLEVAA